MVQTNIVKQDGFLTKVLVVINVLVFAWMWFSDMSLSTTTLVNFGAKISYRIVDGEWYRLITPMFLHANLMHLLFNSAALLSFGIETEMIFGKVRFLIIYFISGLCGSIGSFLWSPGVSVGASGAIFGLLGANLYFLTLNPDLYKRVFGNSVIAILIINVIYGFSSPSIDSSAHIAGLIGGFLITWAIGYRLQKQFDWRNHVARVFIFIFIVGGISLGYYKNYLSEDYYYYKGAFLLNEGDIEAAKIVFTKGATLYPNQSDFNAVLKEIETYKNTLPNQ